MAARFGSRRWTLAAVAVVALVVGVTGAALGSQLSSGVDTYTGCLSSSGDLAKLAKGGAPAKACSGSQVQVSLSGPLPSECAEDDVLTWRSGEWTCAAMPASSNLPDAFVARRQSSASIPANGSFVGLGTLHLQPGSYAVSGRVGVRSQGTGSDPPVDVLCRLTPANEDGTPGSPATGDSDFAQLRLAAFNNPGDEGDVALFVSQRLTAAGDVGLGCSATGNVSGALAYHVSIRAVEVGTITTVDVGPGPLP